MESSTPIPDDIYVHADVASDSEYVLVESSMPVQVARYSLATPMREDGIEYETIATSAVHLVSHSSSLVHISHSYILLT